jgi:hypothetical protein
MNQCAVPVDREGEVEIVVDGVERPALVDQPHAERSPKGRRDLHVAQRGNVKVRVGCGDRPLDRTRPIRAEEELDEGRGIDDDEIQVASRSERSPRISSAAGRPSRIAVRLATRSKTSSAGGRATSRSRMSWM